MPAVRGPIVLCALTCACGGDIVAVNLPDLGSARAYVVASERDGVVREVIALDASDTTGAGPRALIDVLPDEPAAFTVLGYDAALDALGVVPRVPGPADEASGRTIAGLPGRTAAFRAEITADGAGPWKSVHDGLPPAIGATLVPASVGCRRFRRQNLPDLSGQAAFVITMGDRTIVGTEDHHLIPIPPVGTSTDVTLTALPPGETRFPTWGALRIADRPDQLWLAARDGKLWRVRFDAQGRPVEVLDIVGTGRRFPMRWFAGEATVGGRTRVIMMNFDGTVTRWDGATFAIIHAYADNPGANVSGGAVEADDGTIIAGRNVGLEVLVVRPDERVQLLRLESEQAVNGIANVPGLGVLVGDVRGQIHRWTGTRFEHFIDSEIAAGVEAIVPIDGGFIAAGNYGAMREWRREGGLCPPAEPLVDQTLRWWLPFPGGYVVSGPEPSGGTPGVVPLSRILYD